MEFDWLAKLLLNDANELPGAELKSLNEWTVVLSWLSLFKTLGWLAIQEFNELSDNRDMGKTCFDDWTMSLFFKIKFKPLSFMCEREIGVVVFEKSSILIIIIRCLVIVSGRIYVLVDRVCLAVDKQVELLFVVSFLQVSKSDFNVQSKVFRWKRRLLFMTILWTDHFQLLFSSERIWSHFKKMCGKKSKNLYKQKTKMVFNRALLLCDHWSHKRKMR